MYDAGLILNACCLLDTRTVLRTCACRLLSYAPSDPARLPRLRLGLLVLPWERKARHHQAPILALWVGLAGWAAEAAVGIERPISEVLLCATAPVSASGTGARLSEGRESALLLSGGRAPGPPRAEGGKAKGAASGRVGAA